MNSRLFTIAIILIVISSCSKSAVQTTGAESNNLQSHLSLLSAPIGMDSDIPSRYIFKFNASRQASAVDLEQLPCPTAISYAAAYYAIASGDYEVTYGDIAASGYWPFDISFMTDSNISDSHIISSNSSYVVLPDSMLDDIETEDWMLECKSNILNQFYTDYYYYVYSNPDSKNAIASIVTPDQLTQIENFWINPLTMRRFSFGEARGEISEIPYLWNCMGFKPKLSTEQADKAKLILINTTDL